jgi:pimeloyl-ACP methyl ester carboxylesterase
MGDGFLEVQGTRIRYRQVGSGPDLFFLHGMPGSLEDWEPMETLLAPSFRLTFIDRPGYGGSGAEGHEHTVEYSARVALRVIAELALEAVTVVGHSYGAITSIAMALHSPQTPRALVLVAGPLMPSPPFRVEPAYHLVRIPVLGPRLLGALAPLVGRPLLEQGVRAAFHPNEDAIPPGFMDRARQTWLSPKVAVTVAREKLNLALSQRRLCDQYAGLGQRLVLVHGTKDRMVPPAHSIQVHQRVKGSELVLLEGVGHMVQLARPEELARIIRRTVESAGGGVFGEPPVSRSPCEASSADRKRGKEAGRNPSKTDPSI